MLNDSDAKILIVGDELKSGVDKIRDQLTNVEHVITATPEGGDGDEYEALLAAAKVGAVFCPVNWRQTAGELEFVIRDTDPSVVIWQQAEIGEAVTEAKTASGSTALWLQHDAAGAGSYEDFLASGDASDPDLAVETFILEPPPAAG